MGIVNLLLVLVLSTERNLALARAFLELDDPKSALQALDQIRELSYAVEVEKARAYIAHSEPLKALQILQQLLGVRGIGAADKQQLYELVSLAFIKLQEPKRVVHFSDLSSNERCTWDAERGKPCSPVQVPQEISTQEIPQYAPTGNPFEDAVQFQTVAFLKTAALPFLNSYARSPQVQAVEQAQHQVQSVKKGLVEWMQEREHRVGITCATDPFERVANTFQEGLSFAALASDFLAERQLTFGQVVPLQQKAIEKFKQAANYSSQLPTKMAKNEKALYGESQNYQALEAMLKEDQLHAPPPVPKEVNQIIW